MLLIQPLKGLRYNPERVKLSSVITPPYDVISPAEQDRFYRQDPHNFIRVIYGKHHSGDRDGRDVYSRARGVLEQWQREGVLRQDDAPSVYPYEQVYRIGGKPCRRLGVIALVRLDSRVHPHEQIHGGPKQDRLRLMKTVNASLDPIFGLVPDASGAYGRWLKRELGPRKPAVAFSFQRVRHRLWRISDPDWIRKLQRMLRSKELVIADGHHRFEAALAYRRQRRKSDSRRDPNAPYNFVMFYLSAAGREEPGLLPTHRLVKLSTPGRLQVEWRSPGIVVRGRANVLYTQDLKWASEQILRGQAQALLVMPPPQMKDVLARARSGVRMPRKTTYFYPKLVSGLVGYPFGE